MKPVGLTNPHSEEQPYAVVQLRRDNALGTLYNIVGFQTKMKYGAQKEILRMIPGLEEAKFARLGGIHRNSFALVIFVPVKKMFYCNIRIKVLIWRFVRSFISHQFSSFSLMFFCFLQ